MIWSLLCFACTATNNEYIEFHNWRKRMYTSEGFYISYLERVDQEKFLYNYKKHFNAHSESVLKSIDNKIHALETQIVQDLRKRAPYRFEPVFVFDHTISTKQIFDETSYNQFQNYKKNSILYNLLKNDCPCSTNIYNKSNNKTNKRKNIND